MPSVEVNMTMQKKGAMFRRPKHTVQDVTNKFVQFVAEKGEEELSTMLRPQPSGVYKVNSTTTGHYRRNINTAFSSGKAIINDGKVVYGRWLEGVSSRNQTTRFKGYFSFRKTAHLLQKFVKQQAKPFARRYVQRLNRP